MRRRRSPLYRVICALRTALDAWRHVRTGGASTRNRARQRAEAPPEKCPRCRQPIPHSPHWHDHI